MLRFALIRAKEKKYSCEAKARATNEEWLSQSKARDYLHSRSRGQSFCFLLKMKGEKMIIARREIPAQKESRNREERDLRRREGKYRDIVKKERG